MRRRGALEAGGAAAAAGRAQGLTITAPARLLPGRPPVGVRFVAHTADAAVEVRAPTLEALFARAAAGMFAVFVGPRPDGVAVETVAVSVASTGRDELLLGWLEELLYHSEVKGIAFDSFTAEEVSVGRARGKAQGCRFGPKVVPQGPLVKGVSRHGLRVARTGSGWKAYVLFDV